MSGSSVVLMGEDTFPSVASAYGVSVTVQDLEFTLGEGPASDAFAEGQPVLVDDVSLFGSRWPQFSRAITERGVRSLYALPAAVGGDQARRPRALPATSPASSRARIFRPPCWSPSW